MECEFFLFWELFRCQAISAGIKTIEKEYPNVHGCVLKSSNPSIFCAGLDLMELHQPSEERLPQFWNAVQQVYLDVYGSRLAVIGAIEGHAPAAGCMLALCCDYRIMTSSSKATIGFNETKLGRFSIINIQSFSKIIFLDNDLYV